jgi:hypothetical protein
MEDSWILRYTNIYFERYIRQDECNDVNHFIIDQMVFHFYPLDKSLKVEHVKKRTKSQNQLYL